MVFKIFLWIKAHKIVIEEKNMLNLEKICCKSKKVYVLKG